MKTLEEIHNTMRTDYIRGLFAACLKNIWEASAGKTIELSFNSIDTSYLRPDWIQNFAQVLFSQKQKVNIEVVFRGFKANFEEKHLLLEVLSKHENFRIITLDFGGCDLNDGQFNKLLNVMEDSRDYLEKIYCFGNKLTDGCVDNFFKFLEFCTSLDKLYFGYNAEMTYFGAREIIKAVKNSGANISEINFEGITLSYIEKEDLDHKVENINKSMNLN